MSSVQKPYTVVTTDYDLSQLVPKLLRYGKREPLALDTETTSLDPKKGTVRLVQLGTADHTYVVDVFRCNGAILGPLFDGSVHLIGQNINFDLRHLKRKGWADLAHGRNLFCTMIAHQLVYAGDMLFYESNLESMSLRFLGEPLDKWGQKADWSGPLTDQHYEYASKDAAVLRPIASDLHKLIIENGLERIFSLEMRCLPAVGWLMDNGV